MLAALTRENDSLRETSGRRVALLLKIAPDLDEAAIDDIAQQLVDHHLDGVIATNTTLARDGIAGADHAHEAGGLSGAPLGDRATGVIARLRRVLPAGFPIIGVGGIVRPSDALARLDAGADLVQLYSGLIYRGPGLIAQCALAASSRRAQVSPD